nr:ribonuclease H-like domain-containing protein [Tanacetum cinerariifolium]
MHSLNSHLDDALRVLRYLKGSLGSGIQINKTGNLKLRAYADSNWARSSTEVAYKSMASTTCEVIWFLNLLGDMGVKNLLPVVMYCDNSFALQIAENLVFHEKSKHFEIDVHLVREKVASGVIKIEKIHTTQQIANIFTKGLDIEQHKILCGSVTSFVRWIEDYPLPDGLKMPSHIGSYDGKGDPGANKDRHKSSRNMKTTRYERLSMVREKHNVRREVSPIDDESLSDEDVLEDNVKIYSNPLFEFDDEYISSNVNPLFDKVLENIESKDSYDSNLDEPDLLVTPLSNANKDECFDLGGDDD